MNCHMMSEALSLLAKTPPPAAMGFGRTGLCLANIQVRHIQAISEYSLKT